METLSDDIMINILSRRSVETLSRLKCVSHLWRSLISSSPFLSAKKPLFLFSTRGLYQNDGSFIIHISSVDHQRTVQKSFTKKLISMVDSLQSCSSLVCLIGSVTIYVCNPRTEELVTLPPPSPCAKNVVGFGYSYSTEQYKVVHLFRSGYDVMNDPQIECQVFTLGCEESSSRRVENCPYYVYSSPPPFVEGSLHWVISDYYHTSYSEIILSFDLDREEFRVIHHPEWCFPQLFQAAAAFGGVEGAFVCGKVYSIFKT